MVAPSEMRTITIDPFGSKTGMAYSLGSSRGVADDSWTFRGRKVLETDDRKEQAEEHEISARPNVPNVPRYTVWTLYEVEGGGWRVADLRYERWSPYSHSSSPGDPLKLTGGGLSDVILTRPEVARRYPAVADAAVRAGVWTLKDVTPPTPPPSASSSGDDDLSGLMDDDDDGGAGDVEYGGDEESGLDTDK